MLDSEWLDIAISVALLWFVFAVVVSATNEAINRILAIRSKQLWKALSQLIDGRDKPTGLLGNIVDLPKWRGRPSDPGDSTSILRELYGSTTVQGLENRTGDGQKTRIHNIPTKTFAEALLELATDASHTTTDAATQINAFIDRVPNAGFKTQLTGLWKTAGGDVERFRTNIERWFDGQMSRLTELYRTQTRVILAAIGIVVAVGGFGLGLRTDSLALVSNLQNDRNLRTVLTSTAGQVTSSDLVKAGCPSAGPTAAPAPPSSAASTPSAAECELKGLRSIKQIDLVLHDKGPKASANVAYRLGFLVRHGWAVLGVLLTGVAISFGATFWFGVLQRLVGLRGAKTQT